MARPRTLSAAFARIRQEERLLYDWLRDRHDEFATELAAVRVRDRWTRALKVIGEQKLVDDRGNQVTRDTAIRTWKRVREDVAAARARRQGAPPPTLAPGEVAPGVCAVGDSGWDRLTEPAGSSASSSRPLVPQAAAQAPADGSDLGTAPAGSEHVGTKADRMRHLLNSMRAGKVPLPKTI